jgi:hypothetical protein
MSSAARRRDEGKDIMSVYTIDAENNITIFSSPKQMEGSEEGCQTFCNREELAALAVHWPGARLVEIWNSLPGVEAIERFTSRSIAAARIWKAIQHLQPGGGARGRSVAPRKGTAMKKASRKAGSPHGKTKTSQVVALLRQSKGASLKAIMRVTGWQAHSVRGFISGQLGKKMGLSVRSFEREGERVYLIKD